MKITYVKRTKNAMETMRALQDLRALLDPRKMKSTVGRHDVVLIVRKLKKDE